MTTIDQLTDVIDRLAQADAQASALRQQRNQLLYTAMTIDGCTERTAATLGNVSPSYAHRVRVHGGSPLSGPLTDRASHQPETT